MTLTCGRISGGELQRICPKCGHPMDIHQEHEIILKHVPLQMRPHLLKVSRKRVRCRGGCGYLQMQEIPFQDAQHRKTKHLRYLVEKRLSEGGHTLKAVSRELGGVHPSIVKMVDKERLKRMFPAKRPPHKYSEYIAIDEFLLHRGHRYATVVLDLQEEHVIWCSEGKKKQQVSDFIGGDLGEDWMHHVKAVSMDMNAQYDSAFRELCPWIAVIYDAFQETDPRSLFRGGLRQWLRMASDSGVQEVLDFAKTIRKRIRSLVLHAVYPINSGKLEGGTNNLIKTIRRQSYGFRDTEYFFLKIMEASRKPYYRYQSHRILS